MPARSGIAFVLVQHLAPGEDDLRLDVLRPLSPVPVEVAQDGAAPEPDRLQVAPAGHVVRLRRGRFVVRPARGIEERRSSVDRFFRSLAEDAGPCAVGIVLSGSGSDGALGLEAIGAAGGLTMAQAPATAAQAEMPESAAASSPCDHVLPPEGLARTLLAYAAHLHSLPDGPASVARHRAMHAAVPQMCDTLRRVTGNDFRHYKTTTLVRRLERRMQVLQIADLDTYLERLDSDEGEARTLFRELLIGVTSFFRDPEAFGALATKVLAPLLSGRSPTDELRIWVPGCATGEEAYSIAMLAREALDGLAHPPRLQVFATDIDERALAIARRGSYPQGISAQVSPERLQRFFVRRGRRYQVAPELREMCLFTAHNLISDPPFSRLDLISCRNLLIYMGPHLQKKLFPVFHYALKPGGYLFLGSSESLAGQAELFRPIDAKARLAQRKDARGVAPGGLREFGGQGLPGLRGPDQVAEPDLGAIAQRMLLSEFAPRYAIVSEQGHVVHLSEGVDKYLQPPVGSYSNAVTRMARRGLSVGLRSSLAQAVQRRRTVVHELPAVQTSEGLARVRLTVQPMPELGHGEGLYMLVFEDLGPAARPATEAGAAPPQAEAVIEGLERELAQAREEVERAAQDQEAANEELKSSNEELLSMNEELQSANEELEASKEEVQAANRSLEQANADLENLLRSTRIATVFLDRQGLVRGFTPAAAEIYNLQSFDVGRPLEDLRSRLTNLPDVPAFPDVSARTEPLEHVARHLDGRWFLRRVLPYQGTEGAADGVLVTFVDISTQKRAEEEERRATALLAAVGATTPDLIYAKDRQGRLLFANPATWAAIERTAEEALGRTEFEFLRDPDEARAIMAADQAVMETGETRVVEEPVTGQDGTTRIWRSTKSPMRDEAGMVIGLVGVSTDITALRQTEARAREDAERVQLALDAGAIVGTWDWDIPNDYFRADARFARSFGLDPEHCREGLTIDEVVANVHPEDLLGLQTAIAEVIGRGGAYAHQYRVRNADGEYRWIEANGRVDKAPDGTALRFPGVLLDIHERRAVEAERDRARRLLEAFVEAVPGVVYAKDRQGRMLVANRGTTELIGKPPEAYLGRTDAEFLDDAEQAAAVMMTDERIMASGQGEQVEEEVSFPDGRRAVWLSTKAPLRDEDGQVVGLIGSSVDITARKEMEEELAETTRRLDAVLGNTRMAVFLMDDRQHCAYANAAAEELTGYAFAEMQGRPLHDVVHHTRPDGSHYPLEECPIDRAFPENNQTEGEEVFVHKDGHFYPVAFTASPIRDETSKTVGTIIEARDIREEKARDAALTEALQAKKVLLHEVNHRVKNSLQLVTSLLMLQAGQAKDPQLKQALMEARGRLSVVSAMHQRLYSTSQHDRVDFGDYLRDMAGETLRSLDANGQISLSSDVEAGLVLPLTQAVPLALVVSELVTNAVKYAFQGRDKGRLSVRLRRTPEGARIEVADDGVGLPDGFDPKRSGGLGMKIVTSLVRQVRGKLSLEGVKPGTKAAIDVPLNTLAGDGGSQA
ncbi:PAS domain-containing protein [Rubellimicrobium aerolatum]|uniref:protein-glutamate O-methyltransferase n=1 Tax=Rubellimicrobium aerolatum TaxID=490979 RepID=A0ABW0SDI7_9RHOB